MTEIITQGYADRYQLDTDEEYPTTFFGCVNKDKFIVEVFFDFNTFANAKHLAT